MAARVAAETARANAPAATAVAAAAAAAPAARREAARAPCCSRLHRRAVPTGQRSRRPAAGAFEASKSHWKLLRGSYLRRGRSGGRPLKFDMFTPRFADAQRVVEGRMDVGTRVWWWVVSGRCMSHGASLSFR